MTDISTDYIPTVDQVAALVSNRTRDENGNEMRTFLPEVDGRTNPTQEQVQAIILDAVSEVYPVFGDSLPDNPGDSTRAGYDADILRKAGSRIVALRSAALIELTYYADQVGSGRSPYPQYQDSFEKGLTRMGKAISEAGAGDAPGTSDDSLSVAWSMPCNPMLGLDTRW